MPYLYPELRLVALVDGEEIYSLDEDSYFRNVWGNAGNNRIEGNSFDNTLLGDGGIDTLIGGAGNDTYGVDEEGDVVVEEDGGGIDTVWSSTSYTLPDFVENLMLKEGGDSDGFGNALSNRIVGNEGMNALYGGQGDDSLFGGEGADFLFGDEGNDFLDGGEGADEMTGGAGNDSYVVDSLDDLIFEEAGGGIDTVFSSISYSIADQPDLENITLTGTEALNATGNDGANRLIGNAGANVLMGGAGNDYLCGGKGADTLYGGAGKDKFVLDVRPPKGSHDMIVDFNYRDDTIYLDDAAFPKLKEGAVSPRLFCLGSRATDSSDRFIYNKAKGYLYFDADGVGAAKQVLIATFKPGAHLTYSDLYVI